MQLHRRYDTHHMSPSLFCWYTMLHIFSRLPVRLDESAAPTQIAAVLHVRSLVFELGFYALAVNAR